MRDQPMRIGEEVPMGFGSIVLRDSPKKGLHIIRLSGEGHPRYTLRLRREGKYRLGPDYGGRVISAAEERHPIKRVLRLLELGVHRLRLSGGEFLLTTHERCVFLPDGSERIYSRLIITDGEKDLCGSRQGGSTTQHFIRVTGASYAFACESVQNRTRGFRIFIPQVWTWPHCDPAVLESTLRSALTGTPVTKENAAPAMIS
jgi:hypothetical protein